ncbi:hypothetical protein, partial [Mycobacterium tuberculosis]
RRSNSRLPTTLNARDQPPAEVSDQRVSGLTGAVQCPNSSTDCRPSHAYQLDAFAAAVLRGQAVKTTPKDAVENMSAIHAIYRAAGLPSRNPS